MMIKSADVHPGDPIAARDRATVLEDLRALDGRLAALEAISGPGAWQNCLNCLSEVFFWGIGEVTADLGSDTYTLKPKYISNANTTTTAAMTTADMNVATGIKPAITATAVGAGTVSVEDEFLVFGGFDAGEDTGEPIVRYFFECRGGGGGSGLIKITTATAPLKGDLKESGTAMSSWDDNDGDHYDVTDEGNGCVKVDDVFPAFLDSGGTWRIASIYSRLKDTS